MTTELGVLFKSGSCSCTFEKRAKSMHQAMRSLPGVACARYDVTRGRAG
jgi:hypothetical protein